MTPPKHDRNDVAIAQKAINLARGLSGADKAVASAILAHYNKKTGQCDPSNERLAALLDLDQSTVRRATATLSNEGFFVKKSHGGRSCRASYTPQWSKFKALVDDWDRRMLTGAPPETEGGNSAELPGSEADQTVQNCPPNSAELHAEQCRIALQTHIYNPYIEPISPKAPTEHDAETIEMSKSEQPSHGLLRREKAAPKPPGYEARERVATAGCSRSDAAWMAASRRVDAAIARADADWRHEMWIVVGQEQMDQAIRQELRRRGDGIACLQGAVRLARLQPIGGDHVH